jgi:hypothetical protein
LFLGRQVRTKFSLLQPSDHQNLKSDHINSSTQQYQDNMVRQFNNKQSTKYRKFEIGNHVLFRNYRKGQELWIPGVIVVVKGVIHTIKSSNLGGSLVRRHANQIRARLCPQDDGSPARQGHDNIQTPAASQYRTPPNSPQTPKQATPPKSILRSPNTTSPMADQTPQNSGIRRSVRFRLPPKKLSPDPSQKSYC